MYIWPLLGTASAKVQASSVTKNNISSLKGTVHQDKNGISIITVRTETTICGPARLGNRYADLGKDISCYILKGNFFYNL
jgi:hypothetical protein